MCVCVCMCTLEAVKTKRSVEQEQLPPFLPVLLRRRVSTS